MPQIPLAGRIPGYKRPHVHVQVQEYPPLSNLYVTSKPPI